VAYPIHTRLEYQEKASRLTTFFRLILAIPHLIVVVLWGIAAFFVAIAAWFAILFTGRYPAGMFGFQMGFLNYSTRVRCYVSLLTDKFPPFGGGSPEDGYPILVTAELPEHLSRLTTFFRLILAIPAYVVQYFLSILEQLMTIAAWFVILVIGRLPQTLFEIMELPQRYYVRYNAYTFLLTTDRYPWFQPEDEPNDVPSSDWNQPLPPPSAQSL